MTGSRRAAARFFFASWVVFTAVVAARAKPGSLELGGGGPGSGSGAWANHPARPSRLVKRYDFEETDDQGVKLGRGYPMPPHWYAIGRDPQTADPTFDRQPMNHSLVTRRGFPAYTQVGYGSTHHRSGDFALRLALNGGSAGAFLEVGALPAIPGSDYRVTAKVRTDKLRRAAAAVTACFIDAGGRRLPGTLVRADRLRTGGRWTTVSLRLVGDAPRAAWIGLKVELLQPHASPADPLGRQQVVMKDIHGQAWFDDIAVWQMPHASLGTQSPVNLVRAPARPRLGMSVRDLTGQRLTARVNVYDLSRRRVAHATRRVGAGRENQWGWTPDLPGYGWYLAELKVYRRGGKSKSGGGGANEQDSSNTGAPAPAPAAAHTAGPLVRAYGTFAWLAPTAAPMPLTDAVRFGLDAHDAGPAALGLTPRVLDATGLGSVLIPAWRRDTTRGNIERRRRDADALVARLAEGGREVAMSLEPVPDALAHHAGVEADTALGVLKADPKQWLGYVAPVLMSQGQRVHRWQLGVTPPPAEPAIGSAAAGPAADGPPTGGPGRPVGASPWLDDPDLPGLMKKIGDRLRKLAPGPRIVLPASVLASPRSDMPDGVGYALNVPPGVRPAQVGRYRKPWRAQRGGITLGMNVPGGDRLSGTRRVNALVRRMLQAWAGGPVNMSLAKPWATRPRGHDATLAPGPLLPAYAATAHRLAGRRVVDRLDLGPGLAAMVLDGKAGGMLAAWADQAPDDQRTVTMYLGKHPVAVDPWGNRRPLPDAPGGKQRLTLSSTPTFIEGINPSLARFRAAFHLDKPFIQSLQTTHHRTLHLANPWPRTISGSFRITGPKGWTIRPQKHRFSIPSGGSLDVPLNLRFPITEATGAKKLSARFDFHADHRYQVDLAAPMTLGMRDLKLVASLSLSPPAPNGKRDARVQLIITNTSDKPRSLYLFASLPGFPRREQPIPRLQPGASVIRALRFPHALQSLQRYPVRCGVREANGPAVLNQKLHLNQAF